MGHQIEVVAAVGADLGEGPVWLPDRRALQWVDAFRGRVLRSRLEGPYAWQSCAFGGPGRSTLYLTTARYGLSEQQLAKEPLAGHLLAVDVGRVGLDVHPSVFGGPR